ncbi:hypothetical protein EI534_00860 [Pseudomonas frederiksbergensis]|nr:hypothetical protein [Pseudomonas frederiksbergensis]
MAYDPGRYYWSAAFMSAMGNSGIMALRLSLELFQALGIFVGLLLITRTSKFHNKHSLPFLLLASIIFALWMFPRHKIFDLSLSIFLTGALAFLVENPTRRRYFTVGVCVGLVAFFGRNHGIYGVAGSLGVMAWLCIKSADNPGFFRGGFLWGLGVAVGFSPVFFMAIFISGFGLAFEESIRLLFEIKTTNIPLPIPWPWTVNFTSSSMIEVVRQLLIGILFIAILVFGVASISWIVLRRFKGKYSPPAFVAASFLALPYAHYAFSRADIGHLAQGVFPFLVGCLTLLSIQSPKNKWSLGLLLGAVSFWVMSAFQPGGQCLTSKQCVDIDISGSRLKIDPNTANDIIMLRKLTAEYAPDGQNIIVTPFWPGAYSLLERKSPMWTIYALWPRTIDFQQQEIDRIKAATPKFALIVDWALDGRDDLRFKNTYPLIYQYIQNNFLRLPDSPAPAYEVYIAKEAKP